MATYETVELSCDLPGCRTPEKEVGTHKLMVDGETRELELCANHASALDRAVDKFMAVGRPVHLMRANGHMAMRRGRTIRDRQQSADMRRWARQHSMSISERGRIPAQVEEAYAAAH